MAIVIHEFEVESQPERGAPDAAAAPSPPVATPIGTSKIERALRHQLERASRIWAH